MAEKLAIATMAWDKKGNPGEILTGLSRLTAQEYPVYVADGGSSPAFMAAMIGLGCQVEKSGPGVTRQLKNSLNRAAEAAEYVLYTEPDKSDWFEENLTEAIEAYMKTPGEMTLVGRTEEQMLTYPPHQRMWEQKFNELAGVITGVKGDFVYGPKFFPAELAREVSSLPDRYGWQIVTFLIARAHKLGLPINILKLASDCPESQRQEDNAGYRARQYRENREGLVAGLLSDNPRVPQPA